MAENNIEKNNIGFPKNQGLYDSSKEHDSCGVGFIVDTKNNASHDIVSKGLSMLCNLEHRGAVGADPKAGDGSGILIQIPHEFFEKEINHFELPQKNEYAVGVLFLRKDEELKNKILKKIENVCINENIPFLGWRLSPTYEEELGWSVKPTTPYVYHLFVGKPDNTIEQDDFERKIYV